MDFSRSSTNLLPPDSWKEKKAYTSDSHNLSGYNIDQKFKTVFSHTPGGNDHMTVQILHRLEKISFVYTLHSVYQRIGIRHAVTPYTIQDRRKIISKDHFSVNSRSVIQHYKACFFHHKQGKLIILPYLGDHLRASHFPYFCKHQHKHIRQEKYRRMV